MSVVRFRVVVKTRNKNLRHAYFEVGIDERKLLDAETKAKILESATQKLHDEEQISSIGICTRYSTYPEVYYRQIEGNHAGEMVWAPQADISAGFAVAYAAKKQRKQ
ncbi:MAG TPA: hypothetical protein VD907_00605 [Verrucomicrobiae bacterium]|nr:hypothetical protein [Verrucomicrobiae bacterium]